MTTSKKPLPPFRDECEARFDMRPRNGTGLVIFDCRLKKGHSGRHRREGSKGTAGFSFEWSA